MQFSVSITCRKFGLKHTNNPVERYNEKIKDRLNSMRGEFKSFEYAESFVNLQYVINNFVNPHQPHQHLGGKTPAEKARIKMGLGRNKLLGLIREIARSFT